MPTAGALEEGESKEEGELEFHTETASASLDDRRALFKTGSHNNGKASNSNSPIKYGL